MAAHPRSASGGNSAPSAPTSARIDVWLWSVRQIKSRSAATSACKAGHVRINGETAKPDQNKGPHSFKGVRTFLLTALRQQTFTFFRCHPYQHKPHLHPT